jgi:hypothetical protein
MWMLLVACGQVELQTCEGYDEPVAAGVAEGMEEASGLAMSRTQGVVWTHEDGATTGLQAFDMDGDHEGTWTLTGVGLTDLEDAAMGPDGQLWLADIGDNDRVRSSVQIVLLDEPDVDDGAGAWPAVATELTYPDGPVNAEALFVDNDGVAWVIERADHARPTLYRADLDGGTMDEHATLEIPGDGSPRVTAADMTPEGDRLMLRTPDRVLVYNRVDDADWADVLEGTPCSARVAVEAQGEAVAAADWGFLTLSEGDDPTLYRSTRR